MKAKGSMRQKKYLLRGLMVCALLGPLLATQMSPAGFSSQDTRTHVEIDGVNYGSFDQVDGIEDLNSSSSEQVTPAGYKRVTLKRDFVTDPSLYLWAKNIMRGRSDLKDVHVVVENREGEELSRYVLKFCQPLSWTVEAANPALGGFHETIDLAVQEIAVY